MSDKPIHAEIVRADQIRVGDRILCNGIHAVGVQRISSPFTAWTEICFDDGHPTVHVPRDKFVARILPEPVEVREFWRMKTTLKNDGYVRFEDERKTRDELIDLMPGEPARREYDYRIEHVRETILSREEVRP